MSKGALVEDRDDFDQLVNSLHIVSKIKSVLSLHAEIFFFQSALFKVKLNGKFLLASLKTLIYSSLLSRISSLPLTDFRLCFSAVGQFSPVYVSQLASGTTNGNNFQDHSRLPVSILRNGFYLQRDTEKMF